MAGVLGGLTELVELLDDAGLAATYDGARLNPPAAWVAAQSVDAGTLCGGGTLTAHVYLVAPNTDPRSAYRQLDAMLAIAVEVLPELTEETSVNESVALTDGAAPAPAYRLTTTIEI